MTPSPDPRLRWPSVALLAALALITAIVAGAVRAETVDGRRIVIIDGDTVALPGNPSERVRLLDIDAPESWRASCEAELRAGLRAKERLAALLRAGPVTIERCPMTGDRCTDIYGRTLARLRLANRREAGAVLVSEGLALPYVPGEAGARAQHWCGRAR